MSQAINKEDIVKGQPFTEIAQDIEVGLTAITKFDTKIIQLATHLQKDLASALNTNLQGIEKVDKAMIESEKLLQAKLKTQQAEIKLQEQQRKATEAQERSQERANKATEKAIKLAEKEASVYSKVDKKLADMVKAYRDLAVRKELGAKLTDKEAKDMDFLAKKIQYYDTALKNVDATTGKYQRNVGNYKSTFDGMTFSVTQLAREMPAFGNSVQTGFMAISNNLPMFFDEIQKLKQANVELVKSGEAPKSVFKSLASSIMSTQVLLSVGVTLLTLYGAKLVEWGSSLFKVNKEVDEHAQKMAYMNKQRKESSEFVAEESAEFIGNLNALRKTTQGSKERAEMIDKINDKYGITLKNLKDEKEFTKQLNKEVGRYLELQIEKYRQQQNEQKIITNLKLQDKLRYDTQQRQKELNRLKKEEIILNQQAEALAKRVGVAPQALELMYNRIKANAEAQKENSEAIIENNKQLEEAKVRIKKYDIEVEEDTEKTDSNTDSRHKQIDSLKKIQIEFEKTKSIVADYSQILNEIENIRTDSRLRLLEQEINEEIEMELEKARKTGKYETEILNELYARKRDIQIAQIDDQTRFELDQIKKKNEQEYLLEVEHNNKMYQQNRESILKQYDEEKKSIKDQLDQIERDDKLDASEKKRRIEILNQQLLELEKDFKDKKLVLEDKYNASKDTIESNNAKREQGYKNEEVKATEQANEKKAESNKEYFEATDETNKKLSDEAKKYQKEIFDFAQQVQEAITDMLKQQIDQRIALLQKESDFAKSQQDYLQNLAAQGNIFAKNSIAEQIQIQRDAQEEQLRLEKQKQNIEMISTGLKTFEGELSKGKSPAEALATTLVTTKTLVQLLSNLNFFAKGTDNAPEGYAVTDEQGAELHLDKNGNIKDFGSTKGAQMKYLERGDKIITASKTAQLFSDISNANKMAKVKDSAGNSYDLKPLLQEMQGMRNDIKNNATQIKVHWDTMGNIIEQINKGGNQTTNRYRVK